MIPTIDHRDDDTVVLTGELKFVRGILGEAKMSAQAQMGAFGISQAYRAKVRTFIEQVETLRNQLPPIPPMGGEAPSFTSPAEMKGYAAPVDAVDPLGDLLG